MKKWHPLLQMATLMATMVVMQLVAILLFGKRSTQLADQLAVAKIQAEECAGRNARYYLEQSDLFAQLESCGSLMRTERETVAAIRDPVGPPEPELILCRRYDGCIVDVEVFAESCPPKAGVEIVQWILFPHQAVFGDVAPPCDGALSADDMLYVIGLFETAKYRRHADLMPCGAPDGVIDGDDINAIIEAFQGRSPCE